MWYGGARSSKVWKHTESIPKLSCQEYMLSRFTQYQINVTNASKMNLESAKNVKKILKNPWSK